MLKVVAGTAFVLWCVAALIILALCEILDHTPGFRHRV